MNNKFQLQLSSFVHYHNGELYNMLGEGTHTETQEPLVFFWNQEGQLLAQPKDDFYKNAIEDITTNSLIESDFNFFSVSEYRGNSSTSCCYLIGECRHLITEETLMVYANQHNKILAKPRKLFFDFMSEPQMKQENA